MTKRRGKGYKLDWKGPEVQKKFTEAVAEGFVDFALTVEKNAKAELYKGHGVVTGTLRRSIHIAQDGYNWSGDNVEPKGGGRNTKGQFTAGAPERGGKRVSALGRNGKLLLQVGSGMVYALWVEMGGQGFAGYRYLRNGLAKTKPMLRDFLKRRVERVFKKSKKK
ncbi:MAG: hypothetical protein HZB51_34175 [Chloroflexi bacterium]|nr:hypothetical protein [Chloroflexota bacterium]